MAVYAYKGIDARGKAVKGTRDADNAKALRMVLKRDGVLATEILEQAEAARKTARDIDFGRLFRRVSPMDVAVATRQLSVLLRSGVPLVEALESVAGATGNIVFETGVMQMRDEVATGQRLQQAMENTDLFPNMVIQMIAVGEESGSLDEMSGKVADFYEADVDDAVDNLSSLLEPMIMAILGVLVGGLVVAMYLPIFKLGAVV